MRVFQARAKLLISAEYMVLHGSLALALPLKKGQTLVKIKSSNPALFTWNAFHMGTSWFSALFNLTTLEVVKSSNQEKALHLQKLLRACLSLEPQFRKELRHWDVETHLDFAPEWGFGSSSTLTALMGQWAGISPLDLHFSISKGSGYDVACATANQAILYSLRNNEPRYQVVPFQPAFADNLYFVWLGKKQPTSTHLAEMAGQLAPEPEEIRQITALTQAMLESSELSEFRKLMEEHEEKIAELTGIKRVAETTFPGLQGSVKSLGAWGGDFVLIATEQEEEALFQYLDGLGLHTRFTYKDLVYGA
jgi:mevalonate kinase